MNNGNINSRNINNRNMNNRSVNNRSMNNRKRRKKQSKAKVLAGVIFVGALLGGYYHLEHASNEGQMLLASAGIVDTVDETEYAYASDDNNEYATEAVTEGVVNLDVNPDIYTLLGNKGYQINNLPGIADGVLSSYEYNDVNQDLGVTTGEVYFRTGPSTDYEIIDVLKNNSRVNLVARCENGWYLVQKNGTFGFVSGDWIHEVDYEAIQEQLNALPSLVPVVEALTDVNVRPISESLDSTYGILPQGNTVKMIRKLDNGWYEVYYDGKIGYVSGEYVKEGYALAGEYRNIVTLNSDTILTDAPLGTEIETLPQYEIAKVYAEVDEFYYVESNGHLGFVPKNNCTSLNGVYVVVDISDQRLTMYRDREPLLGCDVVTGKDETPTDIGLFNIYSKEQNAVLQGPGYSCPVSYWMPFNGGEGLHDASWRWSFGGEQYHYDGSHGCVNISPEDVAYIYDNVEVGTPVLIKR